MENELTKLTNISMIAKSHIVSIDFILPYETHDFVFVEEEVKVWNILGFKFKKTIPSHYVRIGFEFSKPYTRDKVKEMLSDTEFIGEDGKVYTKPHIRVVLDNEKSLRDYFDDVNVCKVIYDKLIEKFDSPSSALMFRDWK